jgi:hypothetical protein
MTPEKLELLREWILAEIDYKIDENNLPTESCHSYSTDRIDKLFFQVLQAFCGTD